MSTDEIISTVEGGVTVRLKAVPGAKRDEIAGVLGDRLKIRISAPPEGGKANKAICALLAGALGVKARDVEIVSGHASATKVAQIHHIDEAHARTVLLGASPGRRR